MASSTLTTSQRSSRESTRSTYSSSTRRSLRRSSTRPERRNDRSGRRADRRTSAARQRRISENIYQTTGVAVRNGITRSSSQELKKSEQRRARRKKNLIIASLVTLLLGAILIVLAINSHNASQAGPLNELAATNQQLRERDAQLSKQLQENMSPSALAEKASGMGMVPASDTATLIQQGRRVIVSGTPRTAQGSTLMGINPNLQELKELEVQDSGEARLEPVAMKKRKEALPTGQQTPAPAQVTAQSQAAQKKKKQSQQRRRKLQPRVIDGTRANQ